MAQQTITFIGGGNMATSLVGGLVKVGHPPGRLRVADPDGERRRAHEEGFGIATYEDNAAAVRGADAVVFAVKPQVMSGVVRGVADAVRTSAPLVLSVAAGVRVSDICRWLSHEAAVVRTMPNTPALLGVGASGLYANARADAARRALGEQIMRAAGITVWVDDEAQLDAVTALSGSGPAYYFLLMEMMAKVGAELGVPAEAARALTLQTALGAARMALESGDDPATLRRKVTSPGGTTERAVRSFLDSGFESHVRDALTAARDRAVELGDLLGEE